MAIVAGYELWRGSSRLNGDPIVAIVTLDSINRKTGNMAQVWILCQDLDPVSALKLDLDVGVCGDCPLRGSRGKGRACYVNVGQAPLAVWRAWKRGRYPKLARRRYLEVFGDRAVRLGAYGEPTAVPASLMLALADAASRHTAYTHQWKRFPGAKRYAMASVDSPASKATASARGWRTFRSCLDSEPEIPGEIVCPASVHPNQVKCEACGICRGIDSPTDVAIRVHGSRVNVGNYSRLRN